eukprot:39523-Eustigmatos_ZCMA.PRE.1
MGDPRSSARCSGAEGTPRGRCTGTQRSGRLCHHSSCRALCAGCPLCPHRRIAPTSEPGDCDIHLPHLGTQTLGPRRIHIYA